MLPVLCAMVLRLWGCQQPDLPTCSCFPWTRVMLVQQKCSLNQPHTSNVCQTVDCALRLSPLAGRVQCTEQALKIFWIGRNLTARGGKCLQQIVEPRAHVLWRGRECVVVLAHSGRNVRTGHWFTFLKENGVWWTPDLP